MLLLATKEAQVKALPNAPEAADLLRQFGFQPRVQRIAGNAAQESLAGEKNFHLKQTTLKLHVSGSLSPART